MPRRASRKPNAVLLEVITRHLPSRPNLLRVNQESLAVQTDRDWMQTVVVDPVGRGCAWANRNLATLADHVTGEYVWVLDDDDYCVRPTFVEELRDVVMTMSPDVVVVKMDHGAELGVLPKLQWNTRAILEGDIGVSALVVRREIWRRHAGAWGERYAGDYDFARAVMDDLGLRVVWWDVVASAISRRSMGEGE